MAQAAGVAVEFSQNVGDPAITICAVAKSWEADLILVGSRGRRGLSELVLGSVSNHIMHHAPCSVLVVHGGVMAQAKTANPELVGVGPQAG
jgi:nucleotide-binding universal stress UspA family protein